MDFHSSFTQTLDVAHAAAAGQAERRGPLALGSPHHHRVSSNCVHSESFGASFRSTVPDPSFRKSHSIRPLQDDRPRTGGRQAPLASLAMGGSAFGGAPKQNHLA